MKKFPHYKQLDSMDCGPTCLRMVAKYYGSEYSTAQLRELCEIGKDGVNLLGIAQAAERIGFRTLRPPQRLYLRLLGSDGGGLGGDGSSLSGDGFVFFGEELLHQFVI